MVSIQVVQKTISFKVSNKSVLLKAESNDVVFNIVKSAGETSFIPKSIINAKGDLIVGNELAEPMRLPIGSPNYFMVVDPSEDRGYKFTNEVDGGTF